MTSSDKNPPTFGFLTVIDNAEQGLIGGYLILNLAGRPMEFHCTAPVRANRAQEILYGPTLQPYLYGEQIGRVLHDRAKSKPALICTNVEHILSLRGFCPVPVVQVDSRQDTGQENDSTSAGTFVHFSLGYTAVRVSRMHEKDQQEAVQFWENHSIDLDLREPFERINEAIREARQAA